MPKKINSFTLHPNSKIDIYEMEKYLNKTFGPDRNKDGSEHYWYLGRNYRRPSAESHLEIKFWGEPNKKHTLMMLKYPCTVIHEDADEWFEVDSKVIDNLFEEVA